ncbi:MAG: helix-turn-helix transcriptional regulator [Ferruginibacter sp.]|nr:helix-turn-helix transcriptional regulator [Ferruginibacter sp.]
MLNNTPADTKRFIYKQTDYTNWLKEFATAIGCESTGNSVIFSPGAGQGSCTAFFLEKGLTACVNNYQLKEDYLFTRLPSDNRGVIIYLYHLQTEAPVVYQLDKESISLDNGSIFTLRITSAQSSQHLKFGRTTAVRGISIYLNNEWIENNLHQPVLEMVNYLEESNNFKQFINARQQRLLNEILDVPASHPYPGVYIRSRILRILDRLLENFLQYDISESPEKINDGDFIALQKIETILTLSYDEAFPGIEKLSRLSLMSESKLKKLFKQSFGMGLYEYFQKNRMHRAKDHIVSGNYSISEVGTKLGYQNLSNFSTAFRKEFNCLPSELDNN